MFRSRRCRSRVGLGYYRPDIVDEGLRDSRGCGLDHAVVSPCSCRHVSSQRLVKTLQARAALSPRHHRSPGGTEETDALRQSIHAPSTTAATHWRKKERRLTHARGCRSAANGRKGGTRGGKSRAKQSKQSKWPRAHEEKAPATCLRRVWMGENLQEEVQSNFPSSIRAPRFNLYAGLFALLSCCIPALVYLQLISMKPVHLPRRLPTDFGAVGRPCKEPFPPGCLHAVPSDSAPSLAHCCFRPPRSPRRISPRPVPPHRTLARGHRDHPPTTSSPPPSPPSSPIINVCTVRSQRVAYPSTRADSRPFMQRAASAASCT